METLLITALFLPLISFLFMAGCYRSISRNVAGALATAIVFISFVLFAIVLVSHIQEGFTTYEKTLYSIIPMKPIEANFTIRGDSLSLWMTMIITGVGGLIHLFSIGYMGHDPGVVRYFAFLNFFVFAMLLLVLAGDLFVFFLGWEGVGLASYLLIGFWFERESAARAATKAFVINRLADCALLLGIILTYLAYHTGDMEKIQQMAQSGSGRDFLPWIALLFFVGAAGKSAQLPLHLWLPDAMEGPTPVSALIHAATMVTAGVFLVVKMEVLFLAAPVVLYLIAIVGGITALYASLAGSGQMDLKRVLAYSTISQLGFMFLACGLGAFYTAMFHMTTHAFMKALLFLAAGNVIHALHDTTSMDKMGGMAKKMPVTAALFFVGILAMSGIPPLSAFFSKDLILEEGWAYGFELLFTASLIASFFTAFYLGRAFCLTFLGEAKTDVSEMPGQSMMIPVVLLALLSIFGGFLGSGFDAVPPLERLLHNLHITEVETELTTHFTLTLPIVLSVATALLGLIIAFVAYTRFLERLGKTVVILQRAFYLDDIAEVVLVKPYGWMAKKIGFGVEPLLFQEPIDKAAEIVNYSAKISQKMQSGQIRSYAAWMVVGSVVWMIYLVFRSMA